MEKLTSIHIHKITIIKLSSALTVHCIWTILLEYNNDKTLNTTNIYLPLRASLYDCKLALRGRYKMSLFNLKRAPSSCYNTSIVSSKVLTERIPYRIPKGEPIYLHTLWCKTFRYTQISPKQKEHCNTVIYQHNLTS